MRSFEISVDLPPDRAEAAVREALAEQGFGVLTEIDVAATLTAKLGVERAPLKILGACNPTLAHRALELDPTVGLLLPCNVTVEVRDGRTHVAAVDPRDLLDDERFRELAEDGAARLRAAIEAVGRAA